MIPAHASSPCLPRINITHIDLAQTNDLDDDSDVADPATRARASSAEEDEEVATEISLVPPPPRFCSADACSVRKDVTRKARRLLPSPATPSGEGLGQQVDPATGLGMGAAAHVGVEEWGRSSSSSSRFGEVVSAC